MLVSALIIVGLIVPLLALIRAVAGCAPRIRTANASAPVTWTRSSALRSLAFWSVSAPLRWRSFRRPGFLVHQIAFLEPALGRNASGIAVAITTAMAISVV